MKQLPNPSLGMVGRPATKSLIEANSWSPLTTTIRKPRIRYILYVASKATQTSSLFLLALGQVGNRGKTYFGADSGEEDMLIDKEAINR